MNDLEMEANKAMAGYRPEKMIIRLSSDLRIVDDEGLPVALTTANALAVFMHEYFHFLHNISTATGLAGFINMIEVWRLFRRTIDQTGFSAGSGQLDTSFHQHYETLVKLLYNVKHVHKPSWNNIVAPTSIEIYSAKLIASVEDTEGTLLSTIECRAQVEDASGTTECHTIEISVQEIMEAAAWLLERRYVDKSDSDEPDPGTEVFPYKVASALIKYLLPTADGNSVLGCIIAALQSTDPAEALMGIIEVAKTAENQRASVFEAVQKAAREVVTSNENELLNQLNKIEGEFSGQSIMAVGIRAITSQARSALQLRKSEPFFEIAFVDLLAAKEVSVDDIMKKIPACNVLQENPGPIDDLQRDLLVSFQSENTNGTDSEVGLRVIHAIFDFVGRHISNVGFFATDQLPNRQCPFYTTCGLSLRESVASICKDTPWKSADWSGWDHNGKCNYGVAVAITRPPPA